VVKCPAKVEFCGEITESMAS